MESIKNLIKKFLDIRSVRYLISSCTAFAADYLLLLPLNGALEGVMFLSMELSAVISFIVSSQINFWINRRWVFHSEKAVFPELGGYYSLALVSFSIKTFILLELFVRVFHIPLAIARPLAEISLFAFNYTVQKTVIFRKRKK